MTGEPSGAPALDNLDTTVNRMAADLAAGGSEILPPDSSALDAATSEARECVDLVGNVWSQLIPPVAEIFTPEANARAAKALGPVFVKYGLSLSVLGPEIMAAITVGPMLWGAVKVTREYAAAQARAAKAPAAAPGYVAQANSGTALQPGTV